MLQVAPIPQTPAEPYAPAKEPLVTTQPTTEVTPEPHILKDLTSVERLLFTKRLRVKSVLFLRGKKNKFLVRTPDQNLVYTVEEQNSWWVGYFCYGLRPLQLHVRDNAGVEVMRINRPYACTSRILPCHLQRIQVFSPPGNPIGTIEQQWAPVRPIYLVKRENGEHAFWLKGPLVTISFFREVRFSVCRADGSPAGSTCKRWQGLLHALFFAPITDRFGIAFDRDLTVEEKALLLAATLLLDYMYYDA
ncbi:phospholipid scramblase 2-like [Danaus plexippus]|uniref:Phospholipid scramblase n=1 Tax=Danaus plexippus plexippus TaxID=278856 RepID=A0A212FK39_DANPL|nr:phospholipid scramblase 2-like [Danaus plexippus]OWR54108.1 phospholipid scramblase [Danaus plexippus plexippus]